MKNITKIFDRMLINPRIRAFHNEFWSHWNFYEKILKNKKVRNISPNSTKKSFFCWNLIALGVGPLSSLPACSTPGKSIWDRRRRPEPCAKLILPLWVSWSVSAWVSASVTCTLFDYRDVLWKPAKAGINWASDSPATLWIELVFASTSENRKR